jgi:hypothetical protein
VISFTNVPVECLPYAHSASGTNVTTSPSFAECGPHTARLDDPSLPSGSVGTKAGVGVLAAVLVAAMAAVVLVGGLGGSATVEVEPDAFDPEMLAGGIIVAGKHETGGLELLGFRVRPRTLWVELGVAAAPVCIEATVNGEDRLLGDGPCRAYADIAGQVVGGGVTTRGLRWVEVQIEVPRVCFEATAIGEPWPGDHPTCR